MNNERLTSHKLFNSYNNMTRERRQSRCCYFPLICTTLFKLGLVRIFSCILLLGAFTFMYSISISKKVEFGYSNWPLKKKPYSEKPIINVQFSEPLKLDNTTSQNELAYSWTTRSGYPDSKLIPNISQYYGELGAKIIFTSNLQLFSDLFSQTHVESQTLSRQLSSTADPKERFLNSDGSLLGRLTLKYASFNRTLPHFLSEKDKELFYVTRSNPEALQPPADTQLIGDIGVLYLGKVDKHLDCGWRNSLSNYYSQGDSKITRIARNQQMQSQHDIIVPLLVPDGYAFQHFVDGVLPKLVQIGPFLSSSRVKVMIEKPRDTIILEILEELGFTRKRVVYYPSSGGTSRGYQLNTCITPPLHPGLWNKMRDLLGVQKHLQVSMTDASVVLLTRAKSHNGGRNILNLQEVIHYLRTRYNTTFVLFQGGYNLAQSKAVFGKARLVLGIHGGAFYNVNFSPTETIVAEYVPIDKRSASLEGMASRIVWAMANMNGQRYYRLTEKPLQKHNLQISLNKLKILLDEVDKLQLGLYR